MSQYPPPPGAPGFPPGYPPPPGLPPFGQQGYSLPAISRTSGAAVASLVCGLVLCIPVITGLVAIITGIVGIVETGKPAVKGRGMAIAGLILGIFSLGGYALVGSGVFALWEAASPQRTLIKTYVADLDAGRIDTCLQNSTGNLDHDKLDAASKRLQSWGTLQNTMVFAFGKLPGPVNGICRFSAGQHNFLVFLVKDSTGQFRVDQFIWQN